LTEIPVDQLNSRFSKKSTPKWSTAKSASRTSGSEGSAQVARPGEPTNNAHGATPMARQKAEGFLIGLLLLEPERWQVIQQAITPADFTDGNLLLIAQRYWQAQEDEGPPVLNEFLGLLEEPELKSLAVRWSEEASTMPDSQALMDGSLRHIAEERHREQERKLIAGLRRTSIESSVASENSSADLDALRQLQDRARTRKGVPIV